MLSHSSHYGIYGFRFKGTHQQRVAGVYSLGWEKQISTSYDWNGMTRSEPAIIFQYTLKGIGQIKIKGRTCHLGAGDAFFVKIPSDHRYYLPSDSDGWEFIHLALFGEEAVRSFEAITDNAGHLLKLDLNSKPITTIFELLRKVSNNEINDAYEASSFAYTFLMALHRYILDKKDNETWPEPISKSILFIENNYAHNLSLDDIVDVSGISKYHFTRLFHKTINLTPIQYLTKTRINKSIELLKSEQLTLEEIALKIGFSNGNYFSKVFRSFLGVPPGKFRNSKSFIPVDHLIRDY